MDVGLVVPVASSLLLLLLVLLQLGLRIGLLLFNSNTVVGDTRLDDIVPLLVATGSEFIVEDVVEVESEEDEDEID